jgi:hypothetical protein
MSFILSPVPKEIQTLPELISMIVCNNNLIHREESNSVYRFTVLRFMEKASCVTHVNLDDE